MVFSCRILSSPKHYSTTADKPDTDPCNAICQGYQRNFSSCLPLSALLAATSAICLSYQCYSSLCLPLSALLAIRATDFFLCCRLFLPSTPSVSAINATPPAAYRFRLFSPLPTPSVRAINAIPASAYRFRLYLPSAPSVEAMNTIPRTAYRFWQFLPLQLSNLLALFPLLHSDLRAVPPADDCS
jgi:hypothetical protein